MAEPWIAILREAVTRLGTLQAVADQIGFSRTAVSLILNGKYERNTDRIERAVLSRLTIVGCPHLGETITRERCDQFRARPMPQSDPDKLKHWAACRRCPVNSAIQADRGTP